MHQERADAARARVAAKYREKRRTLFDDCKRDLLRARAHLREATTLLQEVAARLAYEERLDGQGDTTVSLPAIKGPSAM
jgi:hypothetical protein